MTELRVICEVVGEWGEQICRASHELLKLILKWEIREVRNPEH